MLFKRGIGQEIRADGPTSHHSKRGTPTMGGLVIFAATIIGYAVAMLTEFVLDNLGQINGSRGPSASVLLLLGLFVALGAVGFVDDFTKVRRQRSLGLDTKAKLIAQFVIAVGFAILALTFENRGGVAPAEASLSFPRGPGPCHWAPSAS